MTNIYLPINCTALKSYLQSSEKSVSHQFILYDNTSTTSFFDLFLSRRSEVPCFHNHWLFWEKTFTKNLEVTSLNTIDNWSRTFRLLRIISACLLTDQGPEFINVYCWTVIFVHRLVVVEHTDFSKVTWMVFVHQGSVMMLTTGFTTTTGMFSMFPDTTMTSTDVSSLLAVLSESSSHCATLISVTICSLIFFICPM